MEGLLPTGANCAHLLNGVDESIATKTDERRISGSVKRLQTQYKLTHSVRGRYFKAPPPLPLDRLSIPRPHHSIKSPHGRR